MKNLTIILVVLLLSISLYAKDSNNNSKAVAAFNKLKTLEGEWQAKNKAGKTKRLTYKIVAAGTCLQETFEVEGDEKKTMVTMYYLDGDKLMLTHYCVANNQPRMRAQTISDDLKEITFTFFDATNMAGPNDGHMYKAVLRLNDDAGFENAWTFRKNGKEAFTEADHYTRLK